LRILHIQRIFCVLLLLCAAACVLQPVMADNGTFTIAYRGYGGRYIGDTIVFDGRDTYGNTVLLKITGVGLPSEGVPLANLNGMAGTATPVEVDRYGTWKYVWYAANTPGLEKMQTARYVFTATDSANPDKSSTTFLSLEKPGYSISASPNPVKPGEYIMLVGHAKKDITFAKITITDSSGKVVHTYTSPVTSSGDLSYNFHVNMDPGQYTVTVSNPALKAPFGTVISVVPDEGTQPVTTVMTPKEGSASPTTEVTEATMPAPASIPSPTKSPVIPLTILAGLVAGAIVAGISRR
jgi:hypothetical protein